MITQKELKESNRSGLSMRKKMAHLKMVYKCPDLDHTKPQPTQKPTPTTYTNKIHHTRYDNNHNIP